MCAMIIPETSLLSGAQVPLRGDRYFIALCPHENHEELTTHARSQLRTVGVPLPDPVGQRKLGGPARHQLLEPGCGTVITAKANARDTQSPREIPTTRRGKAGPLTVARKR